MEDGKKSSLSFGFAKKKETKVLKKGAIEDEEKTVVEETDFVVSFDKSELKSLKPKEEEKELVIPLIESNRWRQPKKPEDLEKEDSSKKNEKTEETDNVEGKNDAESLAVQELLQDAAARSEEWESRGDGKDRGMVVPLLMQNKVPDGFETDEKLDVQLRPDVATDADYDSIPIDQYGLAMLRGMGWKEDVGIGKNAQGNIRPVDAIPRPKGLGLGADRSLQRQKNHTSGAGDEDNDTEEKDKLKLRAGTHCQVTSGKHTDLYGIIQGLDEENSRAVVKLALGAETISINQMALKLVTEKEYSKYSKYLNKGKVDKYKEKQNKKSKREDSDSESHRKHRHKHHHDNDRQRDGDRKHKHRDSENSEHSDYSDSEKHKRSDKHKHSHRDRDKHRDSDREDRERRKDKKRKHEEPDSRSDKKHKSSSSNGKSKSSPWLRPHLRVRIVDPQYSKGKYFKVKVTVEDVISLDECICKTDEGKVLEGLTQDQLETVIPKSEPGYVMVVSGKHKGQVGEILKKDKSACIATIQMLRDRDSLLKLNYDVICEYMGDIQAEFDY